MNNECEYTNRDAELAETLAAYDVIHKSRMRKLVTLGGTLMVGGAIAPFLAPAAYDPLCLIANVSGFICVAGWVFQR